MVGAARWRLVVKGGWGISQGKKKKKKHNLQKKMTKIKITAKTLTYCLPFARAASNSSRATGPPPMPTMVLQTRTMASLVGDRRDGAMQPPQHESVTKNLRADNNDKKKKRRK